jgi:hypothetical protein
MRKSVYPKRIETMILNAYSKGWDAKKTANYINRSRTAMNLGVSYKHTSIASKFSNLTRA